MSIRKLHGLLEPKSIAVIGASNRVGSVGATVWRNLRAGQFAELPFVLAVTPSLAVKNVKELIEMGKAQPDKLTYASSGKTDLMAGSVDMIFASVLETSGFIKAGKLKALAITSKTRVSAMPDVPTLQESGVSGAESGSWIGLLAPAGTPADFAQLIAVDRKRYARIITDKQLTID